MPNCIRYGVPVARKFGGLACVLATCLCAGAACGAPIIVVVEGDVLGPGGEAMRPEMQQATRAVYAALDSARVPHGATKDSLVEQQGMPQAAVAIFPYNRAISPQEETQLLKYAAAGGKLIVCLMGTPKLTSAMGIGWGDIVEAGRKGQFGGMEFPGSSLPGLPGLVRQSAPRVRACSALPGSAVLGWWRSAAGARTQLPAVVVGPGGAFISGVLQQEGDRQTQGELLRALCAHFAPQVWQQVLPRSEEELRPLGNYASLAHLRDCLLERARAGEDVTRAWRAVQEVLDRIRATWEDLRAGALVKVAAALREIEERAKLAYWMSYPSRQNELRGVWATGTVSPSWEVAMRDLRDANLNAVFPYMCSAGAAWYRSEHLPCVADADRLAEATAAGRRYAIPVHARMLNLYAMCAPAELKEELRKQGRLVMTASGKTGNWLCPTNPANRRLNVRLAVEMATKYPVAGIQFDYLRYDGDDYCFCPACRQAFQERLGRKLQDLPAAVRSGELRDRWRDWRREQITTLVRDLGQALRAVRPDILISASVFLNWETHRDEYGQDWKDWVDRGYLDFVCPMDYTPSNDKFTTYVQRQIGWVAGRVPLCPGIGVNADGMTFPGPQGLLDQITIARNLKTQGWTIFNYDRNLVREYLPVLRLGATSTPTGFLAVWRGPSPDSHGSG